MTIPTVMSFFNLYIKRIFFIIPINTYLKYFLSFFNLFPWYEFLFTELIHHEN